MAQRAIEVDAPVQRLRSNLTLWTCSSLHTVNDAFFAVIFPLLPLLAADLDLSYAEVGLIKTTFSVASSAFQLPVGLLAERWGEYALLVGGNAWVAAGLIGMALAGSYLPLLALSTLAGLGGNTQHPLAASLVSRRVPDGQRATAVGTLNFAGDLGKMVGPPLVALVAIPYGWRTALIALGAFGLVFSAAIARLPVGGPTPPSPLPKREGGNGPTPPAPLPKREGGVRSVGSTDPIPVGAQPHSAEPDPPVGVPPSLAGKGIRGLGLTHPSRFAALGLLGAIDNSTRGAALAFLPFLLSDKGLDAVQVSWLFTVVFVGGALGKFGCGALGDRLGATALILTTELITVGALAFFPGAPILVVPLLALGFGFVLNGTSSVLYAMVADLVPEERRARGYGVYYTLVNASSALAPVLYGVLGDRSGLPTVYAVMAAFTTLTLPLALVLRRTAERARQPTA